MQSGYASSRWPTLADAESLGDDFAATVGCTDPTQVLACMRSKPMAQVLLAFPNGQQEFAQTPRVAWSPVVDGLDIPDQPRVLYEGGAFNRVSIIIGATRDEGWIYADRSFPAGLTPPQYEAAVEAEFGAASDAVLEKYPVAEFQSPKLALSRLISDVEMVCEARRVARLVERTGIPVYFYSFEREADAVVPDLVIHGLDRNFVFGNNFGPPSNYVLNADDLALFHAIGGYWTRFAASGNPNSDSEDVLHWPAFKHPTGQGRGADKYLDSRLAARRGQTPPRRTLRFLGAVLFWVYCRRPCTGCRVLTCWRLRRSESARTRPAGGCTRLQLNVAIFPIRARSTSMRRQFAVGVVAVVRLASHGCGDSSPSFSQNPTGPPNP